MELKAGGIESFLSRHALIGVDANLFIYAIEGNPRYERAASQVLDWVNAKGRSVTSAITMLESASLNGVGRPARGLFAGVPRTGGPGREIVMF